MVSESLSGMHIRDIDHRTAGIYQLACQSLGEKKWPFQITVDQIIPLLVIALF